MTVEFINEEVTDNGFITLAKIIKNMSESRQSALSNLS